VTEDHPSTQKCSICLNDIPYGADYCTHCENFQDGRWKVRAVKDVLPLVVALVAVAGTLIEPVKEALHRPQALLVAAVLSNERVSVANLGDAPGAVSGIQLDYNATPDFGRISLNALADPVVTPGQSKVFDLAIPDYVDWYLPGTAEFTDCRIIVSMRSATGESTTQTFEQTGCWMLQLHRLNAKGISIGGSYRTTRTPDTQSGAPVMEPPSPPPSQPASR